MQALIGVDSCSWIEEVSVDLPPVVEQPHFGPTGFPEWTDELEDMVLGTPQGGGMLAVQYGRELPARAGVLFAAERPGQFGNWRIRAALRLLSDETGLLTVGLQCDGGPLVDEQGRRLTYPRLPREEWVRQRIPHVDTLVDAINFQWRRIDTAALEAHEETKAYMHATSAERIKALLHPKPWWQFW